MSDSDYWENAYKSGEFRHWEFEYPSPELTALLAASVIERNARVLEIGSGGGNDSIFMAECGLEVIGTDISHTALKVALGRAKKAHVQVHWLRSSILELPFCNGSIDFISDRGLFHLIEDRDRPAYASEVFRVLIDGGRALIRGKSKKSAHNQFNPITRETIDNFFSSAKFRKGPVLPIPLFSVEGSMEAIIVMLQKKKQE